MPRPIKGASVYLTQREMQEILIALDLVRGDASEHTLDELEPIFARLEKKLYRYWNTEDEADD